MGTFVRDCDLSETPLGPKHGWPDCLRSAVDLILPSRAQIIIFWGPDLLAVYNDAFAETIGDKHPAALGQPAHEHWAELWSDLGSFLQRVMDTGETVAETDRAFVITRHGYLEDVCFDISFSPMCDDAGEVRGVFGIVTETTDRMGAQSNLRKTEQRLQAIVAHPTSGIALTDAEGNLILVNHRLCEILGRCESELLDMKIQDVTHPDDVPAFNEQFLGMADDEKGFVVEKRWIRRDGTPVWVSISVGPIRVAAEQMRQASVVVTDVTQKKRAEVIERRLAAIIESSEDAILSTDLDMVVTSWNKGAERLYGYRAEEVLGRPVTMLVPGDRPAEEAEIIAHIRNGLRIEPHENVRVHKDGRLIDVSLTVSPVRDEHGIIIGASKIAHDISARKESERLQQILIGEMKHRVKNILATVQAVARQTFGGDPDLQAISDAFEARLSALANAHDLLSRETWDGSDLATVIAASLAAYRDEQFETGGPPIPLGPRVVLAMSLALHELATNAIKYGALSGPDGCVSITWTIEPGDPARCVLRWQERDGPPVVPPESRGFGTRLIEGVLSSEINGHVEITYEPSGLICTIDAALDGGWDQLRPPPLGSN